MRKYVFAVILTSLLMTSCTPFSFGFPGPSEQMYDPGADTTKHDIPQNDISSQTPPNTFYIKGGLPDIGEFTGKIQDRFYEEYTPYFIPSQEYGSIVPYIGSQKEYSTSDGWGRQRYFSYGFCTPEGKIVMDAYDKIDYISSSTTKDGFSYYYMTIRQTSLSSFLAPDKALIIPESGAWCIEIDKGGYMSSAGNGIICVSMPQNDPENDTQIIIYDYSGKKIAVLSGYDSVGEYSCGLMPAFKWGGENSSAYYVDINGKKALGPYREAGSFNSAGVAAVTDMDGNRYLIDNYGNRITDDRYSNIAVIWNDISESGYFAADVKGKFATRDILNPNGEVIGTAQGGTYASWVFPDDGDIIYYYKNNQTGKMTWKRLSDGSEIVNSEYGVSPNQYHNSENIFVYRNEEKNTAVLMDSKGETLAYFDDFNGLMGASSDGRYIVYTSGKYGYEIGDTQSGAGTICLNLYDLQGKKTLFTLPGQGYASFTGNSKYIIVSRYTYIDAMDGYSTYMLYDTEKGEFVFEDLLSLNVVTAGSNTYLNICTQNACTLYDLDLNVILRNYID